MNVINKPSLFQSRGNRSRIAALIACVVPALTAHAAMTVRFSDSWGNTRGGEFTAHVTGSMAGYSLPSQFQTFCLERTEHIAFGRINGVDPFMVSGIDPFADGGGFAGGPQDMLDLRTKFLYEKFATGTLAGYNYSWNRDRSADALQRAIWYLENELEVNPYGEGMTGDSQADAFINFANQAITNGWTDTGRVQVLNIRWAVNWGGFHVGDPAQSQLVLIPAPGAVFLGVVGCVGLVLWRRRASRTATVA